MKKLLTILCLVLLVSCSNEVDPDKLVYRNGLYYEVNSTKPFTGSVVEYHDNGQLEVRENYKKGLRDGFFEEYHDNGQLKERGNNKNGSSDGLFESFYENGYLKKKGNYKNGYREGLWEEYSGWNKEVLYSGVYKEGKREGVHKKFHFSTSNTKQLEYEVNYINGKEEGLVETFNSDGKINDKTNYKNGKKHGLYEDFIGGCLVRRGIYKEDVKDGLWESFDTCSTVLQDKGFFKNGERIQRVSYYPPGNLSSVWCYYMDDIGIERTDLNKSINSRDDNYELFLNQYSKSILDGTYCETTTRPVLSKESREYLSKKKEEEFNKYWEVEKKVWGQIFDEEELEDLRKRTYENFRYPR